MSPTAPAPLAEAPAPAPSARAVIARQMAALDRLTEIGMALAEEAGRRGTAPAEPDARADRADPGLMFARAARAVRMGIALQSRLLADLAALDRGESLAEAAKATAHRNRVRRLVERAVEAACDDADEAERLGMDAHERLVDREDNPDFAERPIAEIVTLICADLDLSPAETARAVAAVSPDGAGGAPGVSPEAFRACVAVDKGPEPARPARADVLAESG